MTPDDGVRIIVPCYNEAARLDADAFVRSTRERPGISFCFVDDGSTDDTVQVMRRIQAASPSSVHLLHLNRNRGKAEAVRLGMVEALSDPAVRYVGYWDADLATPLDAIPLFVERLDGDPRLFLVTGARVQLLGRTISRSTMRHYTGRAFATAVSIALRLPVYDTQCGAKLWRVGPVARAVWSEPFRSRWIFDVELLARAIRHERVVTGAGVEQRIFELPLPRWIDVRGSKLRARDYARAAWDVAGIYFRYMRGLPRVRAG
jgi:dolichyl-phosphate beta-glucosyltransferase